MKKNYWNRLVEKFSKTKGFQEKVGLLVFADLFTFIVPSDVLIALGVALRPQEWFRMVTATSVASFLGALMVGTLMLCMGPWMMVHWIEPTVPLATLDTIRSKISTWGGPALMGVVFTPLPPTAAIAVYIIGGGSVWLCALFIGLARFIKYFLLCWITAGAQRTWKKRKDVKIKPEQRP